MCATFGLLAGGVAAASYCGSSRFVAALVALAFLVGAAGVATGVYWSLPGRRALRAVAAIAICAFVTVCVFVIAGLTNFAHCPL